MLYSNRVNTLILLGPYLLNHPPSSAAFILINQYVFQNLTYFNELSSYPNHLTETRKNPLPTYPYFLAHYPPMGRGIQMVDSQSLQPQQS